MLRTLSLLLLLAVSKPVSGQMDSVALPGSWTAGVKFMHGFIMPHRNSIVHLQRDHTQGIELSWLTHTRGKNYWEQLYNFPMLGFGYQFLSTGNPDEIGTIHALYPQVLFPLLHNYHMLMTIKFGMGLGYVEKAFDIESNYKNIAIGSKWNAIVTTGFTLRYPYKSKTQFNAGIDFIHLSNGAMKIPNQGFNIPTATLGVNHFFGKPRMLLRHDFPDNSPGIYYTIYAAAGIKELYPPEGNKYGVFAVTGDMLAKVSRKSRVGIGVDYSLDQSLQDRLERDSVKIGAIKANSRIGVHGSYALEIGNWTSVFQTGVYAYNKVSEDGFIFSRLSIRYAFTEKYFACFNLKTHFAKADYFEFGLGYRFTR